MSKSLPSVTHSQLRMALVKVKDITDAVSIKGEPLYMLAPIKGDI